MGRYQVRTSSMFEYVTLPCERSHILPLVILLIELACKCLVHCFLSCSLRSTHPSSTVIDPPCKAVFSRYGVRRSLIFFLEEMLSTVFWRSLFRMTQKRVWSSMNFLIWSLYSKNKLASLVEVGLQVLLHVALQSSLKAKEHDWCESAVSASSFLSYELLHIIPSVCRTVN